MYNVNLNEFKECNECAAQSGTPTLCNGCLARRAAWFAIKQGECDYLNANPIFTISENVNTIHAIELTKREKFAMAAMQGLLSTLGGRIGIIKRAVEYADDLLKELDNESPINK